MEPLTHFFTGACMGRAGLNRKTAYATLAATLAAEAADMDIFWGLRGPVEGLKHHRGITHTFIGVPLVAAVVVGMVWLLHRWNEKRRLRKARPAEPLSRRTPSASPSAARGALGLALFHLLHRRALPHPARLDQQLRRPPVFPVQSPLVCGQFHVHRRAGAVGAFSIGFGHAVVVGSGGSRNRRAPGAVSRARLGDIRPGRHGGTVGMAMGGAQPGPRHAR